MVGTEVLFMALITVLGASGQGPDNASLEAIRENSTTATSPTTLAVPGDSDTLSELDFMKLLKITASSFTDRYQRFISLSTTKNLTESNQQPVTENRFVNMKENVEAKSRNNSLSCTICDLSETDREKFDPDGDRNLSSSNEFIASEKSTLFAPRVVDGGVRSDDAAHNKLTNNTSVLKEGTNEISGVTTFDKRIDSTPLNLSGSKTARNRTDTGNASIDSNFGLTSMKNDENKTIDNGSDEQIKIRIGSTTFLVCSQNILCRDRCEQPMYRSKRLIKREDSQKRNVVGRSRQDDTRKDKHGTVNHDQHTRFQQGEIYNEYINTKQRWTRSADDEKTQSICGNTTTCFCDEMCVVFGDCCVDFFQSCIEINEIYEVLDFILNRGNKRTNSVPNLMNHTKINQNWLRNIMFHFASCEIMGAQNGVVMVNRCPEELDDTTLKRNCENPDINPLPPVTANLIGGNITFRNAFCASCHGIGVEHIQPWVATLECRDDISNNNINTNYLNMQIIRDLINSGECNVSYTTPSGTCWPRKCKHDSRLTKEQQAVLAYNVNKGVCTYTEFILCQVYYIPGNIFKNPSCELCLNITQRNQWNIVDLCCAPFPTDGFPIIRGGSTLTGGIIIILDITGMYAEKDHSATYVCDDKEVFDPFYLECKTLLCPHGFDPFRGKCVQSTEDFIVPEASQIFPNGWGKLDVVTATSEAESYISCDEVLGRSHLVVNHSSFVVDKVVIQDNQDMNWTIPMNTSTTLTECEEFIESEDLGYRQTVDIIVSLTHSPGIDTIDELSELAESLISLTPEANSKQITVSNLGNISQVLNSCPDGGILFPRKDFVLKVKNENLYAVFNFTQNGVYYPLRSIGYEMTLHFFNNVMTVSNTAYICQQSELFSRVDCSIVEYRLNETELFGSRLKILKSNTYFEENDFYIWQGKVFVCSNFEFKGKMSSVMNNVVYRTVNFVLTSVSVLFLFLMLLVYFILPELRTLPGKMTASLAGTMMMTFLFNVFTLVEIRNDYVCPVMAAISHVVTLAHFGWMSAIAVNMALTFGSVTNKIVKNQNAKNTFKIYSAVVWGLSVSLVTVAIILDVTNLNTSTENKSSNATVPVNSGSDFPRYGYPYCTWFSGPLWVRLVFIIIPYFITYTISVTGFIIAIVGIHKTSKHSEKFGIKTSESTRCVIYIKLSTAMGFSWMTSICVNIFPEAVVLSYVNVCLVLLQGVLLFLAFMVNKKVYSLLLMKCCTKPKRKSESGTQISIVTSSTM